MFLNAHKEAVISRGRPWSMKKALRAVFLLLVLVCSACGANSANSAGTTIDFPGYWHFVVVLVLSNATVKDDFAQGGFATPKPGNRFIELQVTATNIQQSDPTGAGSQIGVGDFNLYPVDSNTSIPHEGTSNSLPGNTIPPGNTGVIILYFQVPIQSGVYEVYFQLPAVNTGTHLQWNITIPGGS